MEGLILWQREDKFVKEILAKGTVIYRFMWLHDLLWYVKTNPPVAVISEVLRKKFLEQIHCDKTSGHMGRSKTVQRAKENG